MLGILVGSVAENMYLMHVLNQLQTNRVVFYEYILPYKNIYNFPALSMSEGYGFKGNMIATSLSTASKMVNFAVEQDKVFYIRSLEWTKMQNKIYEQLAIIYHAPIKLITASEEIAWYVKTLWNRDSYIVPELKLQGFLEDYENNRVNLQL